MTGLHEQSVNYISRSTVQKQWNLKKKKRRMRRRRLPELACYGVNRIEQTIPECREMLGDHFDAYVVKFGGD
jgi:hypothetical protein